jgi:hypothetical protein
MTEPLRVLSLGAGVQSSTVLLLSCVGELPKLDAAIFADTQWEPAAVYRHLDWLEAEAARHGIPVYRVTAGNLREQALSERRYPGGTTATALPLFTQTQGKVGMLPRQCTRNFKVRPIRKKLRELSGGSPVEQWIGISRDEASRMRDSDVQWVTHRYPLVFDRPMRRADCLIWLKRAGYPEPPKSACVACPMHDNAGWRRIKQDEKAWADACDFDSKIRERHGAKGALFVHRTGQPLIDVDLSTPEERGQLTLWAMECEGHCGV